MDLRRLTPEERERKIKEIFTLTNETTLSFYEIGERVSMSRTCVSRILSFRKWSSVSKPLGLTVRVDRVRVKGPRRRGVLTNYEIVHAVQAVNGSLTEREALDLNPYHVKVSNRAYRWMEHIIKTLWQLKVKRVAFLKGEVT